MFSEHWLDLIPVVCLMYYVCLYIYEVEAGIWAAI